MPDRILEKIDASAMSLNFGPLKGDVSGKKTGTKFLVRSLTGMGTIASYLVGPQGSTYNGMISPNTLAPIGLIVSFFRILFSKPNQRRTLATIGRPIQRAVPKPVEVVRNVPAERFGDLGGMEEAKEEIRQVVQGHLNPEKYERHGLVRNGILLYGPRGTGKTFLARATAGEFGLHFEYVSAPKLLTRWIGATGENIQVVFAQAAGRKPVLFFIDEIDSLGGGRQDAISDPGGAGREFNNITMALMCAIDQYRGISGFVLMAATNRLDGLDEALIREGRFDIKVRVDLPDEATRAKILEAQLSRKPRKRFDLQCRCPMEESQPDGWRASKPTWRNSLPTSWCSDWCRHWQHSSCCAPFWTLPRGNIRCRQFWQPCSCLAPRPPTT
jgi:hypothetical protein